MIGKYAAKISHVEQGSKDTCEYKNKIHPL